MQGITKRFHGYQTLTLIMSHPKIIASFPIVRILFCILYVQDLTLHLLTIVISTEFVLKNSNSKNGPIDFMQIYSLPLNIYCTL